jgi:hypothetical protein
LAQLGYTDGYDQWRDDATGTLLGGQAGGELHCSACGNHPGDLGASQLVDGEATVESFRRLAATKLLAEIRREEQGFVPVETPVRLPVDEQLVILFREYGMEAYLAATELLSKALQRRFDYARNANTTEAKWGGLAAAICKRDTVPTYKSRAADVEAAILADQSAAFHNAFSAWFSAYDGLMAMAWQFMKLEQDIDDADINAWSTKEEAFEQKARELAKGNADRDWLKALLTTRPDEGLGLLTDLVPESPPDTDS